MLWLRTTTSTCTPHWGQRPTDRMRVSRGAYECGRPASWGEMPGYAWPNRAPRGPRCGRTGDRGPGRGRRDHGPRATGPQGARRRRERGARRGDVVDHQHRQWHPAAHAERRPGKAGGPVEAGLGRPGPTDEQPSTATAEAPPDRAGQQLGVVEAALATAVGGGRRPGDDLGQRWLECRNHRVGDPTDRRVRAAILHASDDLTDDARVRERRGPTVDPGRRHARMRRFEDARTDRAHRAGASAPGARERQQRRQHPPNVRPAYDSPVCTDFGRRPQARTGVGPGLRLRQYR